ncbi:MAG: 16S rRNA (adenine(1518)-N(6)/adenine(1519)-N(6))-dimethyltransferase RsmA [Candidatus Pacebacteria bacterium]|nr:16S rRNA (adenine(1518)-N(6)/adenine(1519)-N(6))-dimethyltransferase RsmA [Candidatus Paceibacterota bacterium]
MSLEAKKSLGQNFLKSKKAISAMISAPEISRGDIVVEIGPGKGALTRPLLETGATVIAFELDQRMVGYLKEEFTEYIDNKKLILVHQDVLEVDIKEFTKGKPYKVVANIPYYITNLIVRNFLSNVYQPTAMCLLIQKEVAERIVSRDGKESILSLSVKIFGDPKYIAKVARQYFSPSPKVDSAIILISDINRQYVPNSKDEEEFFEVIKAAFAQKRKQAIKNLSKLKPRSYWEEIFNSLDLEKKVRAEDITFQKWLQIVDKYNEN